MFKRMIGRSIFWSAGLVCLLASTPTWAQLETEPRFDTYSSFGGVGLMQMPTARMAPEGEFAATVARTAPYLRSSLTMQPLPWFEGVLRYTTIQNVLYGDVSFSGNQLYKDKGFDAKIRLVEESSRFPQIAVGFRDFGGTGLFSSEYIVASRRYYNFDFSLGLGWGYMAGRGDFKNPLASISSFFKTRNQASSIGALRPSYFAGERMVLFGGLIYNTPIPGLLLRMEYDGNDYTHEFFGGVTPARSPINIGLTYLHKDWLDFSLGFERGNELMAQVSVHGNMNKGTGMPKFDPPPEALKPRDLRPAIAAMDRMRRDDAIGHPELRLAQALSDAKYQVDSVSVKGKKATITVSQSTFRNNAKAIGRAARVMANNLPPEVEELTYVNLEGGMETHRVSLMREDLEKAVAYEGSPEEIANHMVIRPPGQKADPDAVVISDTYPEGSWSWSPGMKHHIGGPDSAYVYQTFVRVGGDLQLSRNLSLGGAVIFNLFDNVDVIKLNSDSVLPHVRSDLKEYLQHGRTGVARLHLDYATNFGESWFAHASGGLFEEMFGGVSGEVLYRPFGQRWAVGAELSRVRQRDYDELFSFRNYKVTTGFVDLYYRLPFYGLTTQLSIGQYLAGDRGYTMTVSRQFESGASLGAFFTKTNVSAADFGEGSFDKGFYFSVPMDMLSMYSSRGSVGMGYRPLTRDGGQRLTVPKRLYPTVSGSNPEQLLNDWSKVLD